jgi:predicted ribosome quality control (RQC) complex YloA/Tae2 family protein
MKTDYFETYQIHIGQSAVENSVLVSSASLTDIWFHVFQEPSCHVILKNTEKLHAIPHKVIKRCAYLCKINSKAKTQSKCQIMYSYASNVAPTEIPGQVKTTEYKLLRV